MSGNLHYTDVCRCNHYRAVHLNGRCIGWTSPYVSGCTCIEFQIVNPTPALREQIEQEIEDTESLPELGATSQQQYFEQCGRMAGLRWVLDLLASSGPVVAAPPKQGEVLLHLSPENDRWNKMALGIRDADVPAAVVVPSRETPPQGFAALRGAIPAEESDEDFNAACASLRDTTSPASSLSRAALERPKIICLCGSTKFIDHFAIQTWELELTGAIVLGCTLLPSWYCPVRDHFAELQGVKGQRDEHHLRKIDLADEVLVLNIGGYIGESTRNEIAYATKTGKPVRYLEPLAAPERRDE